MGCGTKELHSAWLTSQSTHGSWKLALWWLQWLYKGWCNWMTLWLWRRACLLHHCSPLPQRFGHLSYLAGCVSPKWQLAHNKDCDDRKSSGRCMAAGRQWATGRDIATLQSMFQGFGRLSCLAGYVAPKWQLAHNKDWDKWIVHGALRWSQLQLQEDRCVAVLLMCL